MLRVIWTDRVRKLYLPGFRRRNYKKSYGFAIWWQTTKLYAHCMTIYFIRQVFFCHIAAGMSYDTVNSNGKKNTCCTHTHSHELHVMHKYEFKPSVSFPKNILRERTFVCLFDGIDLYYVFVNIQNFIPNYWPFIDRSN